MMIYREMNSSGRMKPDSYVAVVGGVNIDIGGRPFHKLIERDSNPGNVSIGSGGVGRNIAHNLSLLGIRVRLLTAIGTDVNALRVQADCAEAGIDIRHARKVPGAETATFLFINDENGDLSLAVSDMKICEMISPEYLKEQRSVLDGACAIVMDANIPEESIRYLAETARAPLFADPVSVTKAVKLLPYLDRIHTFKPNAKEAGALSGIDVHDSASLRKAAGILLSKGVQNLYISYGKEGILVGHKGGSRLYPSVSANARNMTGAGDSFMAGLVYSWCHGFSQADTMRFSAAVAAISVESEKTVNPELSAEAAAKRAGL